MCWTQNYQEGICGFLVESDEGQWSVPGIPFTFPYQVPWLPSMRSPPTTAHRACIGGGMHNWQISGCPL